MCLGCHLALVIEVRTLINLQLSVSELVSAYPTCGGLYYSVSRLAPEKHVPILSWVTGWLNVLGQIAAVAASEWGAALLLLATVSIASDFMYAPTVNQTVATMSGLVVISGMANSLSTYWMEKMTRTYVIFHVLVLVSCVIALLVMAQPENGTPKHSAEYVFTDITNQSGWSPTGWSFMFGFLSVSWAMCKPPMLFEFEIASDILRPQLTWMRPLTSPKKYKTLN
jgi:amino acid transporter